MGYFGKLEDKQKAQHFRRQGLSYKEILQTVKVSRSTISLWCRDIKLTKKQKLKLLANKKFGQKKGSLIAAENKREKRVLRTQEIYNKAKEEIGKITDRDRFLLGIALYAGEGYKMDGKVGFANADPKIISFMMEWFLTVTKITIDRVRGAIWLHEGLDEMKAKSFWSDLTGIPKSQFHKTYIAKNKLDSKKIRKNIHEYGIFSIRFSDSAIHRQIMGWIYAVLDAKIASTFRDSSMVEQVAVKNRSSQ